ncbi:MAG: hypothetical protein ACPGTU_15785, partial [Myxococcota bacterium]
MDLVFTMTAGRTGTRFLSKLIGDNAPDAEVHHERVGFGDFGVQAPDVSLLHEFNFHGMTTKVSQFWDAKLESILRGSSSLYAETSHVLMKAGLVEHVATLAPEHTVHLVILQRDPLDVLTSYHRRGDFGGVANTWLWYLDPAYAQNRLRCTVPDGIHPLIAKRHWYLLEISVRAELYAAQFAHHTGIQIHRVQLEQLNQAESASNFLQGLGIDVTPETVKIGPAQNTSKRMGEIPAGVQRQLTLCAHALRRADPEGLAARL